MKLRLVGVLVALTAIVLLVQDIPLTIYLRTIEQNRIITELQRDAFVIAGRSEEALAAGTALNNKALSDMVQAYSVEEGANVVVIDANGMLVASSDASRVLGKPFEPRPEVKTALSGQTASGERQATNSGMELLYVAVPVLSGANTLGAVRLTYPADELDERVNGRVQQIAVVALLTLLAASVVAFLLASTITRPLRRLQITTSELASGNLTARADTRSGAPELRKLGVDLNTMADRLDRLIHAQRSFAGDASHQLRTPLTALRLRLDQAAEALETDPHAAVDPLDAARAETERLQHVIDGLLLLARSEGTQHELLQFDLAEVAAERIRMWEPLAEEQGVQLILSAPATAPICAIDGAAEQILDNYIDNAISFSRQGQAVVVTISEIAAHPSAKAAAAKIELIVSDSGPGLTPEKRSRAFDRFWREREDNAGSGLGLAIVSQLARASGATVELRESPTGGISATATFLRP